MAVSYAFDEKILRRVRDLCDAHFSLAIEDIRGMRASILQVTKVNNAELIRNNEISFKVGAGVGMEPLPFSKVKA